MSKTYKCGNLFWRKSSTLSDVGAEREQKILKLNSTKYLRLDTGEICEYQKKSDGQKQFRPDNTQSAKERLQRIILTNFCEHNFFMTLTWPAGTSDEICKANFKYWSRKHLTGIPAVYVYERQKNGTLHVHILLFGHKIDCDTWKYGIADIVECGQKFNDAMHLALYLGKYICKDASGAPRNAKSFRCTQAIKRPEVYEDSGDIEIETCAISEYTINLPVFGVVKTTIEIGEAGKEANQIS